MTPENRNRDSIPLRQYADAVASVLREILPTNAIIADAVISELSGKEGDEPGPIPPPHLSHLTRVLPNSRTACEALAEAFRRRHPRCEYVYPRDDGALTRSLLWAVDDSLCEPVERCLYDLLVASLAFAPVQHAVDEAIARLRGSPVVEGTLPISLDWDCDTWSVFTNSRTCRQSLRHA